MFTNEGLVSLDSEVEWEIWYQDTFDRDCPRRVELTGQGLLAGLIELWARHLFETVQADGRPGFSRFNLWWQQAGKSIEVVGPWAGQVRLRAWIYGDKRQTSQGYVEAGDQELLHRVAARHKQLILRGGTSAEILAAVEASASRADFEERLRNWSGLVL